MRVVHRKKNETLSSEKQAALNQKPQHVDYAQRAFDY